MSTLVPKTNTFTSATASTPTISTAWSLPSISNWALGFDRQWRMLEDFQSSVARTTYPPYNIIKISDYEYEIELAVAGFTKKEIDIVQHDGTLTITGKKVVDISGEYLHKGIATRDFEQKFALADYVEVTEASIIDGVLKVELKQDLPEEKRPKTIKIS
jgi:molecular chaperone IbpA